MFLRGQVYVFSHFFPYMSLICLLFSPKEAKHHCLDYCPTCHIILLYGLIDLQFFSGYAWYWLTRIIQKSYRSGIPYVSIVFFCILLAYMFFKLFFKFVYQSKQVEYYND